MTSHCQIWPCAKTMKECCIMSMWHNSILILIWCGVKTLKEKFHPCQSDTFTLTWHCLRNIYTMSYHSQSDIMMLHRQWHGTVSKIYTILYQYWCDTMWSQSHDHWYAIMSNHWSNVVSVSMRHHDLINIDMLFWQNAGIMLYQSWCGTGDTDMTICQNNETFNLCKWWCDLSYWKILHQCLSHSVMSHWHWHDTVSYYLSMYYQSDKTVKQYVSK